jgi:hypothetical protein
MPTKETNCKRLARSPSRTLFWPALGLTNIITTPHAFYGHPLRLAWVLLPLHCEGTHDIAPGSRLPSPFGLALQRGACRYVAVSVAGRVLVSDESAKQIRC